MVISGPYLDLVKAVVVRAVLDALLGADSPCEGCYEAKAKVDVKECALQWWDSRDAEVWCALAGLSYVVPLMRDRSSYPKWVANIRRIRGSRGRKSPWRLKSSSGEAKKKSCAGS